MAPSWDNMCQSLVELRPSHKLDGFLNSSRIKRQPCGLCILLFSTLLYYTLLHFIYTNKVSFHWSFLTLYCCTVPFLLHPTVLYCFPLGPNTWMICLHQLWQNLYVMVSDPGVIWVQFLKIICLHSNLVLDIFSPFCIHY